MRRCIPFLLALLLHALTVTAAQAVACPADSIVLLDHDGIIGNGGVIVSMEATGDRFFRYTSPNGASVTEWGFYDLSLGRFGTVASSGCFFMSYPGQSQARVAVEDRYTIVGPPSAAPIAIEAVLQLDLRASGARTYFCFYGPDYTCSVDAGAITADLSEPATSQTTSFASRINRADSREIAIPLSHAVGEPFTLRMQCSSEATPVADFSVNDDCYNRRGDVTATLWFRGLPPGYQVVSCQGYVGTGTVPAKRTTWGSLKSLYR